MNGRIWSTEHVIETLKSVLRCLELAPGLKINCFNSKSSLMGRKGESYNFLEQYAEFFNCVVVV